MDWRRKVILLVVALFSCLVELHAQDDLVAALERLQRSGISLDTEHLSHLAQRDDLPTAYARVLASMVKEAENCTRDEVYRRADGVCNNWENPIWGAGLHIQERLLPNAYMDGIGTPRILAKSKDHLPSARDVSVNCFPPSEESPEFLDDQMTQMFRQWGQYLDHDVVFTEVQDGPDCCKDHNASCIHPDILTGGPCYPISVHNDHFFKKKCLAFRRSFTTLHDGIHEQINGITSFVDGSTVYGSHQNLQSKLRLGRRGLLRTDENYQFPKDANFKCRAELVQATKCPMAGDGRVNVVAGLTVVHLMFLREHNKIASTLYHMNSHWNDEKIFQETRKIMAALHQHITYREYLPHLIGPQATRAFGLDSGNFVYQPNTNPSILNEFAVAAFRFGHAQLNSVMELNRKPVPLSQTFFQPWLAMHDEHEIERILLENCQKHAQKVDKFFTTEVSNKLFMDVDGPGLSSDLAARNIQRGRDHGVRPYVDYLDQAVGFFNRKGIDVGAPSLPDCYATGTYKSVNDIDLFVGGLHETHLEGAVLGPTFAYIIGEQFRRLKYGDQFFYETHDSKKGFTPAQLKSIKSQSLAHILCRNSALLRTTPRVFTKEDSSTNPPKSCQYFQFFDLSAWKEE